MIYNFFTLKIVFCIIFTFFIAMFMANFVCNERKLLIYSFGTVIAAIMYYIYVEIYKGDNFDLISKNINTEEDIINFYSSINNSFIYREIYATTVS